MSGLLALLDDIAAIAKLAATQLDDVSALATKAGMKSAGVVIDDAAVTPKYVQGLPAARELPIVWKIARGSLFNKLIILLPGALILNAFAPFLLTPILMVGGCYLCFEGAEKVIHALKSHDDHKPKTPKEEYDAAHLEKEKVSDAIKTDFILSAEITAIALAAIETGVLWKQGVVLALVGVGITAVVYGSVAILVKADDVGLKMHQAGRLKATRALGARIVKSMPSVIATIAVIGTAAMLWVGGSIFIHGLKDLGLGAIYNAIHHVAEGVAHVIPFASGFFGWMTTATLDGVFGLALGAILVAGFTFLVGPALKKLKPAKG